MTNSDTFKIGLCLAGAISAGAYTAGVIDYLIEALEEWQTKKESGDLNVPCHNVEISIIGGASAGAMTGVIAAAAMQDKILPVGKLNGDILLTIPSNKFYHSWVDLVSVDMLSELLDKTDIDKNGLQSLLNSNFIDIIADRAIKVSNNDPVTRSYISNNLKIFLTLSNLEGMDFSVSFRANTPKFDKFIVTNHRDYACFMLADSADDYKRDGWIPINFKSQLNLDLAKSATKATGAFPVGLKAREVVRGGDFLNELDWFFDLTKDAQKIFPPTYSTLNIDGGMINNEPFERVRQILIKETSQENSVDYQSYDRFKSTVLLVDPFPSVDSKFKGNSELMSVIGNTLGAMLNQSRVKPSNLISTMSSTEAGQFLIAPVRYENSDSIEGSRAIACGSLGGFGGFISKEFRIHDYFLGRANCEKFLRDHFTVPFNNKNPIFTSGYEKINDKSPFVSSTDGGLQIIPLFEPAQSSLYMPNFSNGKQWPSVERGFINSYRSQMKTRIEKVLMNITNYNCMQRLLVRIGAKLVLNGKLADAVIDTIIEDLSDHMLLGSTKTNQ